MSHPAIRAGLVASVLLLAVMPVKSGFAQEGVPAAGIEAAPAPPVTPAPVIEAAPFQPVAPAPVVEAAPVPEPAPVAVIDDSSLQPGEFVWEPARAEQGEVEVVVSIPLQRAYVYRGGTLIGVTTVSTGRRGHETPTGTFPILQKRREHYSNLYNNAPMPFMQRLTWDGIALHAGQIPGRPASHGCVRLPLAFARHLFGATQIGATVHILDRSPSAGQALAMVRGIETHTGMGGPEEPVEPATD
jgi:lipoprotein-anchoring transpeptidase ErfK/SrfK